MSISMELSVFSTLRPVPLFSRLALAPTFDISFSSLGVSSGVITRLKCTNGVARRICMTSLVRDSAPIEACKRDGIDGSGFIEVVVIGSRKESIMDSCLDSPLRSLHLRFWSISRDSSGESLLQQRLTNGDHASKTMNPMELIQSHPRAIILVASAGYGSDQFEAINILNAVRSGGCLAVAVLLKPFSFEGRRRLEEVDELAGKLQQHTNFCIDIDIEILLQKDLVTLDEALRNANDAVSMAINAASSLISGMHENFIDVMQKDLKELKGSEVRMILESYKEAKVGFGVGNNLKTSVLGAISDCPFFGPGIKGVKAIICIVTSPVPLQKKDVKTILLTFRQTMEYTGDIIVSTAHEPDLEAKVLVTTFFILSPLEEETTNNNIFSGFFPYVLNVFKKYRSQLQIEINNGLGDVPAAMEDSAQPTDIKSQSVEDFEIDSEELVGVSGNGDNDVYSSSEYSLQEEEPSGNSRLVLGDENIEDYGGIQREPIANWGVDPRYQIDKKFPADSGDTTVLSLGGAMAVAMEIEKDAKVNKKPPMEQRRVVVTGMGVETPLGHDPHTFYENLLQGNSGISQIENFDCSEFPTRIAGEIKSFSTEGWVAPKLSKRMDKFMLYLLMAGKKALADGGVTEDVMAEFDKTKCGVLIGSAMGGMKVFNDAIEALRIS